MKCFECCEAISNDDTVTCDLINVKDLGSLVKPSKVIRKICAEAEKTFRINDGVETDMGKLIRLSFRHLDMDVFSTMDDHFLNSDPIENHRLVFVKLVLNEYLTIRIHHKNNLNKEEHNKVKIRNFYKKMIHFKVNVLIIQEIF